MKLVTTVKLLNLAKLKKTAPPLQLNQLAFKSTHQEITHSHYSHTVVNNATLKKPSIQSNHGQRVAKCIKDHFLAIHTRSLIMAASLSPAISQCGGIDA